MVVRRLRAWLLLPALLSGAVSGGLPTVPGTAPAAAAPPSGGAAAPARCTAPARAFRPARLSVPATKRAVPVLARGRDRSGQPKPPPLTKAGKQAFAWDRTVRAGARHGVVRMTAHTYPRWAGPALGNRLLRTLRVGAIVTVTGPRGERLCYRVTRKVSVPARRRVAAYYQSGGAPRLAILVCSGVRRGPGDWSRRTIWFAKPIA